MNIGSAAKIPLRSTTFRDALLEFVGWTSINCRPSAQTSIHLSMTETSGNALRSLAARLPDEAIEFRLGMDFKRTLAPKELRSVEGRLPRLSSYSGFLTKYFSYGDSLTVVRELAAQLPITGRGVMLIITIRELAVPGFEEVSAEASFSRFSAGSSRVAAGVGIHFAAEGVDKESKARMHKVAEVLGVKFGKIALEFDSKIEKPAPVAKAETVPVATRSPEREFAAYVMFRHALALVTKDIDARWAEIDSIPLMLPRFEGFDKRLHDVQSGVREQVNFPSHLRRFVKERLPEFRHLSEGELTTFEKKLTHNLSLILGFERIHHMGLGKAFTLQLGVDFPGTPHEGISRGYNGINVNLFHIFQRALDQPTWVYATNPELANVFDVCEALLSRVLPAAEKRIVEFLSPMPEQVGAAVPRQGALSAREGLSVAMNLAKSWADDIELLRVGSQSTLLMRDRNDAAAGVGWNGRLRDHGCWVFQFQSLKPGGICAVTVPHTGEPDLQIWAHPPQRRDTIGTDFIDSTDLIARARKPLEDAIADEPVYDLFFELPATGNRGTLPHWQLHAMCVNEVKRSRKDILVRCDPKTGEVVEITTR